MSVRIGRTLPPALAPIGFRNIAGGILAMFMGDKATTAFAEKLKEHFNVKYCYLLSSGKASLALILRALKELYPEKDEVLIPAFTCYSVPAAIFRVGLKIRICDIEPETLDFDYNELAEQLSAERLLCVIPTHLFGVTADIPRVRELVGNRDIPIVEDAAQAMGGEFRGRKVGTLGDVGFFSLERGKAFSTVEGGIIVAGSERIGKALQGQIASTSAYSLKEQVALIIYAVVISVFSRPWLYWIPRSLPFLGLGETLFAPDFSIKRMSGFQAGMTVGWQNRLSKIIGIRVKNAGYLTKSGMKSTGDSELLSSGLVRYPVIVRSNSEKISVLRESDRLGLGGADVFPGTVDTIAGLKGYLVGGTSLKASSIVERMVTFPVHPYVTEADMKRIVGLIRKPAGDARKISEFIKNAEERSR